MKAVIIEEPGVVAVREVDRPEAREDEVLLKIHYCGFCGGDLNAYRGTFVLQEYPNVIGHEIGAEIIEAGSRVPSRFVPGLPVTVYPYKHCGTCVACRKGQVNACLNNKTMGVRRPGAMSEYVAVPWQDLIPAEDLSFRRLALVEPLSVGFHAADRGEVHEADTIAVIGTGMVGIGAVCSAAMRKARIIAVDQDNSKLDLARRAGAQHTINTREGSVENQLMELTNGDGPDVVIEAVGNEQTYRTAVDVVASLGRVVCIGYAKNPACFDTSMFVKKEIEIKGSRNAVMNRDFPEVMRMMREMDFPVEELVSREVQVEDAPGALREWDEKRREILKVLVNFNNQ